MPAKATIQEIAKKAKVSSATVSRVFNHKSLVTDDTKEKVKQAMLELGFSLDEILLNGVDAPSKKILLNIPSLSNPYYDEIVRGAQEVAAKRGYFVLINSQHITSNFDSFFYMIKHIDIEGMVILNALDENEADALNKTMPIVQCAEFLADRKDLSYVGIDDVLAAKKMVRHIISTGRRKIALLSGPSRYKYSKDRKLGYLSVLHEEKIEYNEDWVLQLADVDYQSAYASAISLLNSANPPDAIFALSDVFAVAAIKAANTVGLRVPEDVVITGFDNINFTAYTTPSITTLRQPMYQMGYLATEILINKLEKKNEKVQQIILETELIVRESSLIG